jgi:predicted helicase
MSQLLIGQYLNELSDLRRVSGTVRESVVREAFKTLLKGWGRSRDLIFVPEYEYETLTKERRYLDGALLHELRVPFGYWEAKDTKDDLDEEIEKKFRRGYPQDNIIFDDSREAVLIQNKQQVMRCGVDDVSQLQKLLDLFFGYEREEIADFRKAVDQFKNDMPAVLGALRDMIDTTEKNNLKFRKAAAKFLKHAQDTINPNVTAADVREMLIQHILTEEIFSQVFDNADFHRRNNVARELYALEETFFTGGLKHKTLAGLRPYYAAIKSAAALVTGHHEKQKFLKTIYENFYKVYDRKKADRLGVVYTPNEIVRFMIESADWLCQKDFGRALVDKQVEILDPAAGTGTFVTELIEHFRGQPAKMRYKYLEELHANEVAILPYYVANLNIEATYAAFAGDFEEFPNLCFVDTLDNTAALKTQKGQHVGDLFGGVSEENVARIKRQNKKKISVVIGNPPYNANQLNENENNKNREYPEIDRRIKATYIAASTAQKTKLYDMYARFFRWASDRVDENGIVAFVTNRSFIESRTFDGFRKEVVAEFSDIYVVDLGGDVRADPRISGTKHNVFGIQTGVAISFMVKRAKAKGCRIHYARRPQLETAEEKLIFLNTSKLSALSFQNVEPNARGDWINQGAAEFEAFIPIAARGTKHARSESHERAIFSDYSMGFITARDEWLIGEDDAEIAKRVRHLLNVFNSDARLNKQRAMAKLPPEFGDGIKWSRSLKVGAAKGLERQLDPDAFRTVLYRPFVLKRAYFGSGLVEMPNKMPSFFKCEQPNVAIFFNDPGARAPFSPLASSFAAEFHLAASSDGFQGLPRFRYDDHATRVDNITDWALAQFQNYYGKSSKPNRPVTKDAIFQYVYGLLHDPIYREKYILNLKREFPRIPLYSDFWRWAEWGEALIALHTGYEELDPWPLKRNDAPDEKSRKAGLAPKSLLKAHTDTGSIQLDSETQLTGIPKEAWAYRLGNRSALEWILDQYKEKSPKDRTVREQFNVNRFADHKDKVIDLLKRVTRVSVETMKIIDAMRETPSSR